MRIFLSWSGARSHAVAQLFAEWIPSVCFGIDPWISSDDIAKGANWVQAIQDALRGSEGVGLFFVTNSALSSQWFLFEAGAIAMLGHGRVCLMLVEPLGEGILRPPLANYQGTQLTRTDVFKLLQSLNEKLPTPMADQALAKSFDRGWPELEAQVAEILRETEEAGSVPERDPVDRLADIAAATQRIEARLAQFERPAAVSANLGLGTTSYQVYRMPAKLDGGLLGPYLGEFESFEAALSHAEGLIGFGTFDAYRELQAMRPILELATARAHDEETSLRLAKVLEALGPAAKSRWAKVNPKTARFE